MGILSDILGTVAGGVIDVFFSKEQADAYESQSEWWEQWADETAAQQEEEAQAVLDLALYNADLLEGEAETQLELAFDNAAAFELEADYQAFKTEWEFDRHWEDVRFLLGNQQVAIMKSGVEDWGGAVEIKRESIRRASVDAAMIKMEGAFAEWRNRKQAELEIKQGQLTADKLRDMAELSRLEGELGYYRGHAAADITRKTGSYRAADAQSRANAVWWDFGRSFIQPASDLISNIGSAISRS